MSGISSGRLRDSLSVQSPTSTPTENGDETIVWSTDQIRRCDIRPIKTKEMFDGAGETVQGLYEIRFRYESGLFQENKRLLDTRVSPNRVFDIQSISNTNNLDYEVVITAMERKWPLRD